MKVQSLALVAAVCLLQLYTAAPNSRPEIKSIDTKGNYGIKKGYPLKDFNNRLNETAKSNQLDQEEPSADGGSTDDSTAQDLRIGLGIAATIKDDDTKTDVQQPEHKQEIDIASTHQPSDSAPAEDLRVGLGIASLNLKDPNEVDLGDTQPTESTDTDIAEVHKNPVIKPDIDIAGSTDKSNDIQGMGISGLYEHPAIDQDKDLEMNDDQSQGMGISGLHERPATNINQTNTNDQDSQGMDNAALHERPSVSDFTPKLGLGMASMHERPDMKQNAETDVTNPGVGISSLHDHPPLQQQDIQMDALNETIKTDIWVKMGEEEDASATSSKMNGSIYQSLLSLTAPGTQFTVFAPSNSAWDNLSEDVQVALYGSLGSVVSNSLLQYHIVPDVAITSSQILGSESQTVTAMSGFSLRIFDLNGTLKVNGLPVKKADIMASNGVLHIIDRVLVPTHP